MHFYQTSEDQFQEIKMEHMVTISYST